MKPIFGAIIGLLLIASACVAGAGVLIDQATKQAEEDAEKYA